MKCTDGDRVRIWANRFSSATRYHNFAFNRMKKILLYFIFGLVVSQSVTAQKHGNIWYFGDHAGLDFNNSPPTVLLDGQTYLIPTGFPHNEGSTVISDSAGMLLFYSNGRKAWNRNHQVMTNGDSLLGHPSSTQSALIVPQPMSDRFFYLFTTDAFVDDNLQYGFRYSIIDMCADNGLGDVIPSSKNILLLDTVAEKLAAVRHANGIDYWVVTHKYFSDAFYAFQLTANGITNTVISHSGSVHQSSTSPFDTWSAIGQMKISPDGSRIGLCFTNTTPAVAEVFSFNTATGIVSSCLPLPVDSLCPGAYGLEFSPDNSKVYITNAALSVCEADLTAGGGDPDSISNSLITIYQPPVNMNDGGLQLGPDDKIYIAQLNRPYLSVIDNPNGYGASCNFIDTAVWLIYRPCSYSIPSFVAGYNYSNGIVNCSNGIEVNENDDEIRVFSNLMNNLIRFQCASWDHEYFNLEIFDASGRVLKNASGITTDQFEIEKISMSKGIYLYRLWINKETPRSGKFILY